MISRGRVFELARYGLTGALGASLNIGVVLLLTHYGKVHYLLSLIISSILVTVVGFFLNRSWTFRKSGRAQSSEFLRYVVITATQVVVGVVVCAALVELLGIHYLLAVACVAALSAPVIYLLHRGWSFGLSWLRDT